MSDTPNNNEQQEKYDEYFTKGEIYRLLKNNTQAKKYYNKAIEIDPSRSDAYNGLGALFLDKEQYDKAEEIYQEAISNNVEENFGTYCGLGLALYYQGKHKKAIEFFNKADAINENEINIYCFIGDSYFELGDLEKATEYYKKATEYNCSHAYRQLSKIYLKQNNIKEANDCIHKAEIIEFNKED